MEIKMKDSGDPHTSVLEQDILWTVSFLRDLRNLVRQDTNSVKAIQILIEETSRISPASPELLPR